MIIKLSLQEAPDNVISSFAEMLHLLKCSTQHMYTFFFQRAQLPVDLDLISEKNNLKKSSSADWNFSLFRTEFLLPL